MLWIAALLSSMLGFWSAASLAAWAGAPTWVAMVMGLAVALVFPVAWELWAIVQSWGKPKRVRMTTRLLLRMLAVNALFLGVLVVYFPDALQAALTPGSGALVTPHAPETWATPAPEGEVGARAADWPVVAELHAVARDVPSEVETDFATVAQYVAEREPDPLLRVKALHDYVTLRIDFEPARDGLHSQEPEVVFRRRLSRYSGYAKLLSAMGRAAGIEVAYVTGVGRPCDRSTDVRERPPNMEEFGWNAVQIDGKWYLIDASWDDASDEHTYRTEFLFAPPEAFGRSHFPDDPAWQLRRDPLTKAQFLSQPFLSSSFHGQGFALFESHRSALRPADGHVTILMRSPASSHVTAGISQAEGGVALEGAQRRYHECEVVGTRVLSIDCAATDAEQIVELFVYDRAAWERQPGPGETMSVRGRFLASFNVSGSAEPVITDL